MPILTETISWRRARGTRALSLTPAEQTNVKAALRTLASRFGGFRPLALAKTSANAKDDPAARR